MNDYAFVKNEPDENNKAPFPEQGRIGSFAHTEQLQYKKVRLEERLRRVNRALEILAEYKDAEELLSCLADK